MPKKRRARRPNVPLYTGPIAPSTPPAASPFRDMGGGLATSVRPTAASTQIQADYSHIVKDLKRIGVLAGGFVTVLIVLSFFIR